MAADAKWYAGMHLYEWTLVQKVRDATKGSYNTRRKWRVECSCGKRETIPVYYLSGRPNPKKSCGHERAGLPTLNKLTYISWMMMKRRCYFPDHVAYKHYGGRGIHVCEQWLDPKTGFETFLRDMGPRVSTRYSIDRYPNNDGNYEPGNCRWATMKEQRANQRPRPQV